MMIGARHSPIRTEANGRQPRLKTAVDRRLYTATQLMRLAHMTRAQVSYWERKGLVVPLRREGLPIGKPTRLYPATEVLKAAIILEMKHRGLSFQEVQTVIKNLEEHGLRLENAEPYLLTDGYSVYYAKTENEVVDILKHHRQMLLLVPVKEKADAMSLIA